MQRNSSDDGRTQDEGLSNNSDCGSRDIEKCFQKYENSVDLSCMRTG